MGHVNNAVFLTYLEAARITYFEKSFEMKRPEDISVILAHAEIDFLRPIVSPPIKSVEVQIFVSKVGNTSWWLEYHISNPDNPQDIYATAKTVQVVYDYKKRQKMPIPDWMRGILNAQVKQATQ